LNGQKLSRDNPIKVEWESTSPPQQLDMTNDIVEDAPVVSKSRSMGYPKIAQSSVAMLSSITLMAVPSALRDNLKDNCG
jgi:hypothetical protein